MGWMLLRRTRVNFQVSKKSMQGSEKITNSHLPCVFCVTRSLDHISIVSQ